MDKRPIVPIVALAVVGMAFWALLGTSATNSVNIAEASPFAGRLVIQVETPSGVTTYETHNVVTQIGAQRLVSYLRTGTAGADNPIDYISLSNDAGVDNTMTQLAGEYVDFGLARAQGSVSEGTYSFTVSKKFGCTASGKAVQASGIHWASSGDSNMWACANFAGVTLNNGDNITVTWTVYWTV